MVRKARVPGVLLAGLLGALTAVLPAEALPPNQAAGTTLTITLNQPPEANPDAAATDEDTALDVAAAQGVLANDGDPEGKEISVIGFDARSRPRRRQTSRSRWGWSDSASCFLSV